MLGSAPSLAGGAKVKTADYTGVYEDAWSILVFNSGSAVTLTLPATIPGSLWSVTTANIGAGTLTVSRNGHNIDGAAADIALTTGQSLTIYTDGSNWFTSRGRPRLGVDVNSSLVGTRPGLNLIAGSNVTLSGVDNSGSDRVDVTVDASGGSGAGYYSSLTAPPAGSTLTWVNQGGASFTDLSSPGALRMDAPSSATTNYRLLVKTLPTTPFTFTIAVLISCKNANYTAASIIFRESSTGKFFIFGIGVNTGLSLFTQNFNSATSFNANVTAPALISTTIFSYSLLFLRVTDNGGAGNLVCSLGTDLNDDSNSPDFGNVFSTVGRKSFMAGGPDQVRRRDRHREQPHGCELRSLDRHLNSSLPRLDHVPAQKSRKDRVGNPKEHARSAARG